MPILTRFQLMQRAQRSANGALPFVPELPPTQGQSLLISGVTKDSTGAVLGSCAVRLYDTANDVLQGSAVSDAATGAYSFSAGMGRTYYLVAYKAGAPDVAGTTVNVVVVA